MKGYATRSIGCGARDAPHEDDRYVLPVYREEEGLASFHEAYRCSEQSRRIPVRGDLCSGQVSGSSLLVLRKLAENNPNVTVLHLSRRLGHQMSLVAGIDHTRAKPFHDGLRLSILLPSFRNCFRNSRRATISFIRSGNMINGSAFLRGGLRISSTGSRTLCRPWKYRRGSRFPPHFCEGGSPLS